MALQVRRQRSLRSHVEHRQLPNRDTLSGMFSIVRWFSPSRSCRKNYLIRAGTTDCAQLSGNDPWELTAASWTGIVFRRTDASSNMVGLFVAIWLDCDNIFLAIFEHNRNTRSQFFSQTHFTSVNSGMWYSTLLTVQNLTGRCRTVMKMCKLCHVWVNIKLRCILCPKLYRLYINATIIKQCYNFYPCEQDSIRSWIMIVC